MDNSKFSSNDTNNSADALRNATTSVENALVESVSESNRTVYVTISYGVRGRNNIINMQIVTLVVNNNTILRNQFGNNMSARNIRKGMVVNARFSSAMTRSNPPQARAFRIDVVKENASNVISIGRVLEVSQQFSFILTGNSMNDINTQMRYNIDENTRLRDRRGNRINLSSIRRGQTIRVEHASFQTASIPPQTYAFSVQIISR